MEIVSDISVLNLLLFTIPGYVLLKGYGLKVESEFEWAMRSVLFGFIFVLAMNYITPLDTYTELFKNPYAGMVIFSLYAFVAGTTGRLTIAFCKGLFK